MNILGEVFLEELWISEKHHGKLGHNFEPGFLENKKVHIDIQV